MAGPKKHTLLPTDFVNTSRASPAIEVPDSLFVPKTRRKDKRDRKIGINQTVVKNRQPSMSEASGVTLQTLVHEQLERRQIDDEESTVTNNGPAADESTPGPLRIKKHAETIQPQQVIHNHLERNHDSLDSCHPFLPTSQHRRSILGFPVRQHSKNQHSDDLANDSRIEAQQPKRQSFMARARSISRSFSLSSKSSSSQDSTVNTRLAQSQQSKQWKHQNDHAAYSDTGTQSHGYPDTPRNLQKKHYRGHGRRRTSETDTAHARNAAKIIHQLKWTGKHNKRQAVYIDLDRTPTGNRNSMAQSTYSYLVKTPTKTPTRSISTPQFLTERYLFDQNGVSE